MRLIPWLLSAAIMFVGIISGPVLQSPAFAADTHKKSPRAHSAKPGAGAPVPKDSSARATGAGGAPVLTPGQPIAGPTAMRLCMESWDKDTNMTKEEWRATCVRTLKEFPELGPN